MSTMNGERSAGGDERMNAGDAPAVAKHAKEAKLDEGTFNLSVRRFLKKLGVTAQREIELAVREQLKAGKLRGDERLEATATVTVDGLPREVLVTGTITLS
jgi:Family of unknown function (DUF6494)